MPNTAPEITQEQWDAIANKLQAAGEKLRTMQEHEGWQFIGNTLLPELVKDAEALGIKLDDGRRLDGYFHVELTDDDKREMEGAGA